MTHVLLIQRDSNARLEGHASSGRRASRRSRNVFSGDVIDWHRLIPNQSEPTVVRSVIELPGQSKFEATPFLRRDHRESLCG